MIVKLLKMNNKEKNFKAVKDKRNVMYTVIKIMMVSYFLLGMKKKRQGRKVLKIIIITTTTANL